MALRLTYMVVAVGSPESRGVLRVQGPSVEGGSEDRGFLAHAPAHQQQSMAILQYEWPLAEEHAHTPAHNLSAK